jgi:hypothetical protein
MTETLESGGTVTLDFNGSATATVIGPALTIVTADFGLITHLLDGISPHASYFDGTLYVFPPIAAVFEGSPADDTITVYSRDLSIIGGAGDDSITGAVNTSAGYSGPSSNYRVQVDAGSIAVHDNTGATGTDTLVDVSHLQFGDQTIDTTWLAKAAALPAAQLGDLVGLYVAFFNRAPDALGLDYWASRLSDGMSLAQIAKSFFAQPETAAAFPSGMSTQDFVTKVYNNVLGRAPDQAGFDYWVSDLQQGTLTRNTFILAIINGARAPTGGAADAAYLMNKELVGAHFAVEQGLGDAAWAHDVMAHVDATVSSVAAANQMTDGFAAAATASDPHLVVQLVGVHLPDHHS